MDRTVMHIRVKYHINIINLFKVKMYIFTYNIVLRKTIIINTLLSILLIF